MTNKNDYVALNGFDQFMKIRLGFVPSPGDAFYKLHKEIWDKQQQQIDNLFDENKKLEEFVFDCSKSHVESRYKYRAQKLIKIASN